jgi:hypothetical protein
LNGAFDVESLHGPRLAAPRRGSLAKHANNQRVWLGLRNSFPHPYTVDDAYEFIGRAANSQPITDFCIDIARVLEKAGFVLEGRFGKTQ